MWQSSGLMAMAKFRMMSSLGLAVGIGASPTSRGVLALRSHAAWLVTAIVSVGVFSMWLYGSMEIVGRANRLLTVK